jgi:hypothetical protein
MVLEKVCQKYFTEFLQTDIHLLLGTTQQYHFVTATPFVIIGVFPIPHELQHSLL